MPRTRVAKLAFNRGLVSRLGIARADIKRLAMAAEVYVNWMPRVLGSMMLRPGKQHLGSSRADARPFHIPFVFSVADNASVEVTDEAIRVWVNDAVITRAAVSTAVVNGTFDVNLASWSDADEGGATSDWVAGGFMGLTGGGAAFAIRRQQLSVALADRNVEHALHIVIERGPVILRVGTAAGLDDLIEETALDTGAHSLAFTPTGASAWLDFKNPLERTVMVDSVAIEAAGAMVVEAPWLEEDLRKIRFDQSGDILFVACDGNYQQRRIERRATRSWSVVRYQANDGPMRVTNTSTVTITPSGLTGNITMQASSPLFKEEHGPSTHNDGALFRLTSNGQTVSFQITGQNQFTDAIRVTGVDASRPFTVTIDEDALGAATFTLQRSLVSDVGPWNDVKTWTTDVVEVYDDSLDNQIAWYRLGVKTGDYVNGTHDVSLNYTQGGIDGVVRITEFIDSENVEAEVLRALGGVAATEDWAEGEWSDHRGWPTCVAFHDGRLNWDGRDAVQLSISDSFDSFDEFFEGDAAPINRSIGSGPVDSIHWAVSLQRLLLGGEGAEFSIRSSSLDEPLTPTNFNLKAASTQGSAPVQAVKVDQNAIFVQRGGTRLYELAFGASGIDYEATNLSALVPEIGLPGIVKIVVQRQPDTRIHCLRSDGTAAVLVFDKVEQVICWLEVETADSGLIDDVDVLPAAAGDEEDAVYYMVRRSVNGSTKRYREKWALESQCRGGTVNRQADCFITYNQAASSTIGGLTHLIGKSVVVWDNGKCLATSAGEIATFVVSASGQITVTNRGAAYQATQGCVGLQYTAPWQSAKLVELMEAAGGSFSDTQILKALGLVLADTHTKGLKYGHSLTESEMNDFPEVIAGAVVDPDTVHDSLTTDPLAMPGGWSKDARLCLLAKAPRPATVLAAIAELEHHG
jgi:hypothetical protein